MIEPRSAREAHNPTDKSDPKILSLYCRVSAEIGADLVKCIHPGEEDALQTVIDGCTVPVLVAGGSARNMLTPGLSRRSVQVPPGWYTAGISTRRPTLLRSWIATFELCMAKKPYDRYCLTEHRP